MHRFLYDVFKKENLFPGCTNSVMNSFNVLIILDIDECSDKSTHSCDSNANCTNTDGSYQCKCHQGFAGNGHTCSGIFFGNATKIYTTHIRLGLGNGHTCTGLRSTFLNNQTYFQAALTPIQASTDTIALLFYRY